MFDQEMSAQLKSVFDGLEHSIGFSVAPSSHPDQEQLLNLLKGVEETSTKIKVILNEGALVVPYPQFSLFIDENPSGIHFQGIPTGHEFSSLVLAILHLDQKGKRFDQFIQKRIQKLKGPVCLKTFVSLTCENCPDVIQALNQMATIHPDFQHTMIDGAYEQQEIERLGIQGVPSIVHDGKLIHSGKISVVDLLEKLERTFGTEEQKSEAQDLGSFNVVVLGGGPAGASAAIYSARKGLKTALIADRMGGQVQETKGIENLISVLYTEGPQLAAQLREHVQNYKIEVLEHRRVKSISKGITKEIILESGEVLRAETIIVATGAKWRELNVPGEKEYLGRGVAFCPHCDGPFYKGKKVAVVGGGNSGIEAAIDLAGIVKEVVVLEYNDQLKADEVLVKKLRSLPNASVITHARTHEITGNGQKVTSIEYENRATQTIESISLDGVFVQIGLLPNSAFLKGVVELTKMGEVVVDEKGRTSEPGIYAAGDVTTAPYKQIIIAMGEGAKVALAAFEDRMKATPVVSVSA